MKEYGSQQILKNKKNARSDKSSLQKSFWV
jgi:hypothetical protein